MFCVLITPTKNNLTKSNEKKSKCEDKAHNSEKRRAIKGNSKHCMQQHNKSLTYVVSFRNIERLAC